jgi:hypothetical protein
MANTSTFTPAPSFAEFEKQLKVLRLQGPQLLKDKLNVELKSQGQTTQVTKDDIRNTLGFMLDNFLDITAGLKEAQEKIRGEQSPRVPSPEHQLQEQNRNLETPNLSAQSRKQPDWAKKMDLAAMTEIMNIFNQPNLDAKALTTAFNNVMDKLDQDLKNEYQLRNKPRFAPAPTPSAKPEKPR